MSKALSMFTSSVGRKIVMSLTGLFLISFLILHLAINALTLADSPELFNEASHFMGTNWFIQAMQFVLAAGFILHIVQGVILTIQNNQARPVKYTYNKPSANSGLSSRSMIITGLLVLLFLVLHIKDYFLPLHFDGMEGRTDYELVVTLFENGLYTAIYVVSFILLAVHLNHGFQSAFQTIGANHPKYTPVIKKIGVAFCLLMGFGFSAIAIFHYINSL